MWTVEQGPGSGCGSLRAADRGGFGTQVRMKLQLVVSWELAASFRGGLKPPSRILVDGISVRT